VPNVRTRAVSAGVPVTVSGRASDAGGRVGGVEVSVGGGSWHPAAGRESWSYSWTPGASGAVTIRSRAVDDSGNLEGVAACRGEPGLGGAAAGSPPGAKPRKRDRTAPRVRVGPGRVRVSRRGWVRLRVTCPRRERICRVYLRLRRRGVTVARGRFRVAGGKTRTVSLRLKASLRRRLAQSGAVRVVVIGAARDAAGNRATFSARLRLLPPRPRPA
jgi:hypothetical protein